MNDKIIIRRRRVYRYYGISAASRALGVSPQAVSNFVSRRAVGCLRPSYQKRISIVDFDTGKEVSR